MKYCVYRKVARTGDMILFSGQGIASTAIKMVTRSEWSHIGMSIWIKDWDLLACWESTLMSNVEDIESGFIRKGVMLVPLAVRIRAYVGRVVVRRLRRPLNKVELKILRDFRHEVKGRPYEKNWGELVKAGYDGPLGKNTQDLSSLFCSELFVEPWIRMGRIFGLPSNEYVPGDFSDRNFNNFNNIWSNEVNLEI